MAPERALTALIVDDEPLAVERMAILCAAIAGLRVVGTASDGEGALRQLDAAMPDLLLLDIAMPGLGGIGLARALQRRERRPLVVFTTAFDHYAIEAFEVAATDYLLKPVSPDRLRRAIDRARGARPPEAHAVATELWVPHRSDMIRIATSAIDWVEAERDYMRLHLGAHSYLLHMTIAELERRLDPAAFIRLHRSAIVRRGFIERIGRDRAGAWTACLADGRQLRVGRTYMDAARAMAGRG